MQFFLISILAFFATGQALNLPQRSIRSASSNCRPDQVFEQNQCQRLKYSLSALVCDILERSESTNSFLHFQLDANGNAPPTVQVPESVPVSDLFIQNLAVVTEANMSSCLAWSSCVEQCQTWPERNAKQREFEENALEKFSLPSQVNGEILFSKSKDDSDDDESTGPDFVRAIMFGAKKGIELGKQNQARVCDHCRTEFAMKPNHQCSFVQYHYTTRMNALYRKLTESNATLYDRAAKSVKNLSPETLYFHYSMRFLELANLTSCFAQVSCENSCTVYKQTLTDLNVELVGPPALGDDNHNRQTGLTTDVVQQGATLGYKIATTSADCTECGRQYPDCLEDKYEIAKASSQIFG